jgi:hypothetical protein
VNLPLEANVGEEKAMYLYNRKNPFRSRKMVLRIVSDKPLGPIRKDEQDPWGLLQ